MTELLLQRIASDIGLRAAAATDSDGTFSGLACPWDVTDTYGTRFAPKCFSLGGLEDGQRFAMLNMHDPYDAPLGTFAASERDEGLWIEGAWDDTTAGRDARVRARSGSAPGLSVGFAVLAVDPDDEDRFTQVRLREVSQITANFASVPGAEFAEVRATLPRARAGARERIQINAPTTAVDDQLRLLALRAAASSVAGQLLTRP
ncbi:Caudovirus prohead protease [compost metagenome]